MPGGVGGMRGTAWSGTAESAIGVGVEGVAGDNGATGPGAGGVGPTAVVLCEPGSTIASESWILGFVLGSRALEYARYLCEDGQRILGRFCCHDIREVGSGSIGQAIEGSILAQRA